MDMNDDEAALSANLDRLLEESERASSSLHGLMLEMRSGFAEVRSAFASLDSDGKADGLLPGLKSIDAKLDLILDHLQRQG